MTKKKEIAFCSLTRTHKWFKALSMFRETKKNHEIISERWQKSLQSIGKRKVSIKCDQSWGSSWKQIVLFSTASENKLLPSPLSLASSITLDYCYQRLHPGLQEAAAAKNLNQRVAQNIFIYSRKMNDNTQSMALRNHFIFQSC